MQNKRKLMELSDSIFYAVLECQPHCYSNLFKIFESYENTCDFGVTKRMMPYAKIIAQMYAQDNSTHANVIKSKVKLIQVD